jgi:hypothetical protein
MTTTEILSIIHKEHAELEIYEALHTWLLNDRVEWINKAMENKATVKAIKKLANNSNNKNAALEGITNLCN